MVSKDGARVTPDTLFQAASISKPVTALAALSMVEAKQLALDADINTLLTSWKLPHGPGGAHVTLRRLLSHTGGSYTVVQQAMIDRAGKPFADLPAATVPAPLGMKDSSFDQPVPAALLTRTAMPHDGKGEPYKGGPYTYPNWPPPACGRRPATWRASPLACSAMRTYEGKPCSRPRWRAPCFSQ